MTYIQKFFALAALVTVTACSVNDDGEARTNIAPVPQSDAGPETDTLYVNGVIWTGSNGTNDAVTLGVTNGIVSYVGDATATDFTAQETVDLDGRFVMPGFIDNHVHIFEGGASLASVSLRDAETPEVFAQRIFEYAATLSAGQWVLNGNWDHELWGGQLPEKEWIDAETRNTPVFILRLDGHMALANSAALEAAGITSATISPDGGEIVRHPSGEPTGILKGNALNLVLTAIPEATDDELLRAFELAQSHALALGLTQIHAVTANPTETRMLDALRMVQARGAMKIRTYVFTPIEYWQESAALIAQSGSGGDRLRWGGVKGLVDGSLGATTAWFHAPYSDEPETSGSPLTDPQELKNMLAGADAAGLHIAIHAIGDLAIDSLITDMRDVSGDTVSSRRFRIEHFQHPSTAAINAAAKYGIIASMQPYHAIDDGRWAEERIGPERIKTAYAFRSILDAGVTLTFGSDWPVAPLAPIEGVYAAVTRRTTDGANPDGWLPGEKITVEEALAAYTSANAYAGFEEDVAGTLAAGKRADFIVLSEDPRTVGPGELRNIKVLTTVIAGKTVFSLAE